MDVLLPLLILSLYLPLKADLDEAKKQLEDAKQRLKDEREIQESKMAELEEQVDIGQEDHSFALVDVGNVVVGVVAWSAVLFCCFCLWDVCKNYVSAKNTGFGLWNVCTSSVSVKKY